MLEDLKNKGYRGVSIPPFQSHPPTHRFPQLLCPSSFLCVSSCFENASRAHKRAKKYEILYNNVLTASTLTTLFCGFVIMAEGFQAPGLLFKKRFLPGRR